MPVSSEISVAGPYFPNGSTTGFPFDFKATAANEVVAMDQSGATISPALYSVTLDADEGGELTFSVAPQAADYPQIFVVSNPSLTQPSDFDNTGPSFNPAAVTRAFDRAAARDLKQQREIDRSIKVPFGEDAPVMGSLVGADGKGLGIVDGKIVPVVNDVAGAQQILADVTAIAEGVEVDGAAVADDRAAVAADKATTLAARIDAVNAAGAAEEAQAAAEAAQAIAEQIGAAVVYPDWAALSAVTGAADDAAVIFEDGGTHTDPVVGGTVDNVGIYAWSASPAGWERVADTEALKAAVYAAEAAVDAERARSTISVATVGPVEPIDSGTTIGNDNVYYQPAGIEDFDQWVTAIETGMGTAGGFVVVVATVNMDGTLNMLSNAFVSVATGRSTTILPAPMFVPAGAIVGIRRTAGTWYYLPGTIPDSGEIWNTTADPTTNTAKTVMTSNGPRFRVTLTAEIAFKARDAYVRGQTVGAIRELGWPNLVATGTDVPADYSIIFQNAMVAGERITGLMIGTAQAGSLTLFTCTVAGGNSATLKNSVTIPLQAGLNDVSVDLLADAGDYVGVTNAGANFKFQLNSNPEGIAIWARTGAIGTGSAVTSESAHGFEVRIETATGLVAEVAKASRGGNAGMGLLDSADNSGVSDATALFSSAKAGHPSPYVPPGRFSVTALPANGGGFWGPGEVFENDVRQFLPVAPSAFSLWEKLRAEMMEHIVNGDVITLIGDSISEYVYPGNAGARGDHWFNLLTRFANLRVAKDDPGEAGLRPDTGAYVPSWNGITTSGSVSSGTHGPLGAAVNGASIILASGASISFTGAYAYVGVHYQQASGAGSLSFQYNGGAAFATVNASGSAENDKFSGLLASGQTASGAFTITASGGSVEITNIVRLGVKASGPHGRLLTQRIARGGWGFADFTPAANTSSILKIGQMGGGKCVPILALGINDSFGTAPASIVANATTIINALVAGGVTRIYAVPPMRPTSAWDSNYTGGRTFEPASGALRGLYRERGITVIPMDGVNWAGEGMFVDGLHPGLLGQPRMAQAVVQTLANVS